MQVPGVTAVDVQMSARVREAVGADGARQPVPGVKNVIAVGAGKGGVGKTTVAVNLAIALAKCGSKVGIIDGDIYGPNVPIMLGMKTQLTTDGQKIVPAEKYGLQVISMGFLTARRRADHLARPDAARRAAAVLPRSARGRDLDYLVVDLPPGTGDVALSLSQTVPVAGAIVVTTPQQVSLADSRRAVAMYKKLNIPPLGIIENMSYFVCPNCSHEADIFGHGGGEQMADGARRAVPRPHSDLSADSRRQRHRRAADDQRAGFAGGAGVHGGGGADGGAGVDRQLQSIADHSADRGEMTYASGS